MLVDLHAHYAMHLVPEDQQTHELLTSWPSQRLRARIVDLISRWRNYEGPGGEPGVTVKLMRDGEVGVVLSMLYLPFDEIDFGKKHRDPPENAYFKRLTGQLDLVERDLVSNPNATVVSSDAELQAAHKAGKIAFVHAVEGAFHLGGDEAHIRQNVGELATLGVAYITVAHLFNRGVAVVAPALPFLRDWQYKLLFPQGRTGLSQLGRAAVDAMVDNHVLVDITHMSESSIADTFDLLNARDPERRIPLLASHVACRMNGLDYNVSDETIRRVADRKGVLGVIDCQHYIEDGLRQTESFEESFELICTHINHIRKVTDSFDHVAIGSDLDGYIKPALTGIEHMGKMKRLQKALGDRYGPEVARKICSENALRLLRATWSA
jgi:microsomal dipeptidase-like Zn-dependent dipeptidase